MIISRIRTACLALVLATSVFSAEYVFAQSTVVQVGPASGVVNVPSLRAFPRNSLNSRQKKIQAMLDQSYRGHFKNVRTFGELVVSVQRTGIPIQIDQSAYDDSITDGQSVGRLMSGLTLYDMLETKCNEFNATMAMSGNHLRIISMDDATEVDYFTLITYDVSSLVTENYEFEETLIATVAPDDWEDTNGYGVATVRSSGGRKLLVVNQSFKVQRQIQEYLRGMARLQGSGQMARTNSQSAFTESRIIQLPLAPNDGPRIVGGRARGGGFGGGGIGGYGQGGGVF